MSRLLMCGVSAYLVFSGLVWGPVCGGIVVLITFWDYFSEVAREMAEDHVVTRTRRRLRSDLHAPAHPYWTLRAFESRRVSSGITPDDLNLWRRSIACARLYALRYFRVIDQTSKAPSPLPGPVPALE